MASVRCVLLLVFVGSIRLSPCNAETSPCPIVPHPKQYQETGRTATLLAGDAAVIAIGSDASPPERYAAECLRDQIERRFQRKLSICDESQVAESIRQVFLLGQVGTSAWLKRLQQTKRLDLSEQSPGPDGFVIECFDDGGRQVVVVGGSNPRGVIYGQHALFDLLSHQGDAVVFPVVSVRDWPSIAWRGRPHSVLKQHLQPGALDAYLRSRINFTDVRDDPDVPATIIFPPRKASMGLPAGKPLDVPLIKRMIAQSQRRGLFVYGTVSCAVPRERIGEAIKTFEELIALGVDGLWISFDDVGPGESAPELIRQVLQFGARHGITGRRIAITPPPEEYQHIDKQFNHLAATEWGLAEAQWLFTRVPCAEDAQTARRLGMKTLPGWWHNLVNIRGGFLHNGDVLCSLRADGKPAYVDIQPLRNGWHRPDYDQIRDAPSNTDCALLWGVVGGWPEEYQVGALGFWAWEPAAHDWPQTRRAIYRYVYGPSQVDTAETLDDTLAKLKDLFDLPGWRFEPNRGWPPRLKQIADRPKALALIAELEPLLAALQQRAPAETAIDPGRLESIYLEPMRATLSYARKMAQLEYPEYTAADLEPRMIDLIEAGREEEAEKTLAPLGIAIRRQLADIRRELGELKGIEGYAAYWEGRSSGLGYWTKRAKELRQEMTQRFRRMAEAEVATFFPYKETVAPGELDALFASIGDRPAGEVVAQIKPDDWLRTPPSFSGAFCAGRFDRHERSLVAIGYPRGIASEIGQYAEVSAEIPRPDVSGRLVLDFFLNDTRLENRYPGHRFGQLWLNDRLVWEEDIASSRSGREWGTVDVTEAAAGGPNVTVRFRVVDKRPVGDHLSVSFLGPVVLRTIAAKPSASK
ncbi:MAG: hypothetical protein GXY83_25540 [Rhodopirellula sp.]|nr:hypothetical protein [Rhodopirellula sp.]